MDLHLHTPASADYRESNVSYLDILKKAEQKGLDIIAITDHNTAAGYRRYIDEIEDLELLERRNRLTDEEKEQLKEFRRLREKILVLPGFELTATLGFHVLGIFPPETTVRELEHLLLDLHVPAEKLDVGSGEVGATTDVLTAYRLINEAGGLAIAAHANSSHGVAMPGFDFGGQTRIAYTQDENLHALEVTDLTSKSRRRTQLFFSGTKPEYPRKMHCIQGSDAHRLNGIPGNNQELGVGDRPTEILIPEVSFDAIMDVLVAKDFSKTRPYIPAATHEFDPIFSAREEGDTLVQAFHESVGKHGVDRRILQDVVALANTNGGTIYIGASANIRQPVQGVTKPFETSSQLRAEISKHIVPPIDVQVDTLKSAGKQILQMIVPRGTDVPYALDSTQIFVRSENETSLAVRDEIVNLVRDALAVEFAARVENAPLETVQAVEQAQAIVDAQPDDVGNDSPQRSLTAEPAKLPSPPPHTGVEIVSSKARSRGNNQYTMRDLRNNRIIHNVTRSSARKLWQYAIAEHDRSAATKADVKWLGDVGIVKASERAGKLRYDLVQRDSVGDLHVYYGVTDDGIHGAWKDLVESLSGQTPVIEIEEDENGDTPIPESFDAVAPETFDAAEGEMIEPPHAHEPEHSFAFDDGAVPSADESETLEPHQVHQAAHIFATDDAALPSAAEHDLAEPQIGTLEIEAQAAPPILLMTPGRNQFPPVVSDLAPSTQETDDVPASSSLGMLEIETPADTVPLSSELGILEAETSDETATISNELGVLEMEPPAEISTAPESITAEIILPDALDVATAPTTFSEIVPTQIESGETLAPIADAAHDKTPPPPPNIQVNFDDQFVLPPKA